MLHIFLRSCPELHTLALQADSAGFLLQMALTGENKLDCGALRLRTLELVDWRKYCITPKLASVLNTLELKRLVLSSMDEDFLTTRTEMFWSTLSPDAIKLTELKCHRLTPALIHFLCSFSGLERL